VLPLLFLTPSGDGDGDGDELVFDLWATHTLHNRFDQRLASGFEPGDFPFARDQVGPVLAAQPIHVTHEFYAELLNELLVTSL